VKRLLLVRHAATSATRAAAFPADEPIEEDAAAPAAAALARFAARDAGGGAAAVGDAAVGAARRAVVASPALRCAQTAAAAGLAPGIEPRIAECDFGAWAGRSLAELDASAPEQVAAWIGDPDAAPHGGESLRDFAARVAGWLDEQAAEDGTTLAITHGGVVKAALVHALGAPLDAFWRLDVAPLTLTELHAHDRRWTVSRTNCPIELAGHHPSVVGAADAERGATGADRGAVGTHRGAAGAGAGVTS
jgi:broad specificity phosphatase PhoE